MISPDALFFLLQEPTAQEEPAAQDTEQPFSKKWLLVLLILIILYLYTRSLKHGRNRHR